ncbi:MAG TPA: relaxase/mobilization nuclease domain-containing protein, partial [Methylocystis sp.]|nr:relaxase/mobilization nuclease domain-containing protein [Methylocystis sp.]
MTTSIAAKAGLAAGSQAAVVKLASYGSGSARAASLLNYQSDKGQLTLEREDGTLVTGKAAVDDLAAHWREDDAREPSNDVFRVSLIFEGNLDPEEARAGLAVALDGHRYAWRIEDRADSTLLHLVAVAAGARRDDNGKKERIYANEKSIERFHDKIEDAFSRDVDLSAPVWAHGVEGATTQLAALTKAGALPAETDAGISLQEAADRRFSKLPSNANRSKPKNFNSALEIAKTWRPAMRSSSPRDFAHVILSAKPGTDKEAFMDAARATLAREFKGHEYVFVMHTNRQHIHVHAAVRLTCATGEKLHPGIQDFNRWRQTLAEEARERHLPMEAVRRFDQAHTPAYKLKDAKMVERGIAPESVRRRVERVKTQEIHRPTREEGRRRAAEAASEWKSLAARRAVVLPRLAAGAMRLYRAEAANEAFHRAPLYSVDRVFAESFASKGGPSQLVYLDVPAERISELRPSRENPTKIFVVPP